MIILALNAVLCGFFIIISPQSAVWTCAALLSLAALFVQSLCLLRKSRTDPLTGLHNLRHLNTLRLRYRFCPALRVFYFDLDHLKKVNDTRGHAAGDRLLKNFAGQLRSGMPRGSLAFRIGGDEFLLIIPTSSEYSPSPALPASWGSAAGPGSELDSLILESECRMYHSRSEKYASYQ